MIQFFKALVGDTAILDGERPFTSVNISILLI